MTRVPRLGIVLGVFLLVPLSAHAQGPAAIGGFGGMTFNNSTSTTPDLGGNLSFEITPGVQLVGEVGRMGNVLPSLADTIFSAANTGLRASALYAEGGLRFKLTPGAAVSPYAEVSAGISRLDVSSTRLGPIANGLTSAGIALLGRNAPVAGAGGGVLIGAGPLVFDVGYRYKQFFASNPLELALGLGQPLRSHQLRAGFGVRF